LPTKVIENLHVREGRPRLCIQVLGREARTRCGLDGHTVLVEHEAFHAGHRVTYLTVAVVAVGRLGVPVDVDFVVRARFL
jgi:hypothetical protein